MKRIVCISMLLFFAMNVIWSQQRGIVIVENVTFPDDKPYTVIEKGFPVTFTSDDKTYTIEKSKITHTDDAVFIEIFGEGVGKDWVNEKGELVVLCTYLTKGNQYRLPVVCVEQTSIVYTMIAVTGKLPYPETIIFYPTNKGKNNKGIKIKII